MLNILMTRLCSDGVGPNQICTLYGANPGQSDVSGHAYLDVGYQLNTADIWRRNFLVLLGFFFLFQLTQVLLVEFYPVSVGEMKRGHYSDAVVGVLRPSWHYYFLGERRDEGA